MNPRTRRNLCLSVAFLAPNILGFLAFTLIPLGFSLVLAFSNWDVQLHNMFKDDPLKFVGFEHFARLLVKEQDFFRFLGNTLFFMMGIPFSIAGSLGAAILLSRDHRGGGPGVHRWLFVAACLVTCTALLAIVGAGSTAMTILLCGLAGGMLIGGVLGGTTVYRTLFFLPHFTSGVAVYILWKKLYNPHTGPVNGILQEPLELLSRATGSVPAGVMHGVSWIALTGLAALATFTLAKLGRMWWDGEAGLAALTLPTLFLLIPVAFLATWDSMAWSVPAGRPLFIACGLAVAASMVSGSRHSSRIAAPVGRGFGDLLMLGIVLMVLEFLLLGLALVLRLLPEWSADGLAPPNWLASYHWAKPAIMIMGLWGSIGSNNMLLYLAGLSNVPQQLYEAVDIDGASRFQRFWHVTWPQLAPVTFFIVVMSVIGGLQGGFEMARTMTRGGPAGATTTLSYFIYTEGFETGRLGYASGVAWALFAMVFTVTMFNWKFGSRYVND